MKIAVWILIGTAILGGLLIWLAPVGIELYAERWLRGQGIAEPVVRDVDLNLFTGTLRLELVTLSDETTRRGAVGLAEVNAEWTSLFGGHVLLSSLKIADGEIDIEKVDDEGYAISGLVFPLGDGAEEAYDEGSGSMWGFGVADVSIENVTVNYRDARLDSRLIIHELTVDRLATWEADSTTHLAARLELDGARVGIGAEARPFASEPTAQVELVVEQLPLEPYALLAEAAALDDVGGLVSLDVTLDARYGPEGLLATRVSGAAALEGLSAGSPMATLGAERLSWSGDLKTAVSVATDGAVEVSGTTGIKLVGLSLLDPDGPIELLALEELTLDDLMVDARYGPEGLLATRVSGAAALAGLSAGSPMATLGAERLSWSGDLKTAVSLETDSAVEVSGTTGIKVGGLSLRHPDRPIELLALEELSLDDLIVDGIDHVEAGQVSLVGLDLLTVEDTERTTLTIAGAAFRTISIDGKSVVLIEQADFDSVVARVARSKSGELVPVSQVLADFTSTPAPSESETGSPEPPPAKDESIEDQPGEAFSFHIDRLTVGGASSLVARDEAVTPAVSIELILNSVQMQDLGNAHADRPTRLTFDIAQADGGKLVGEGEVRLFGQLASNMRLDLDDFDLTQVSAYLPAYHVQRGRLSMETNAVVSGETLDVSNSVVLSRLQLVGKQGGEDSWLGKGMALPLDVALDLLRDGNDRIVLDLPVTGSLRDPEFGTGDIVRRAMQGALQQAALSYAKNALQPLGTIMLVASVAGQAARPRFDPLPFEPGSTELDVEGQEYLDRIGKLLTERPGLAITFCGVSSPADRDALLAATLLETAAPPDGEPQPEQEPEAPTFADERLDIARERGATVQRHLQSIEGIEPGRLFRCRPTLDDDEDNQPRVEISL